MRRVMLAACAALAVLGLLACGKIQGGAGTSSTPGKANVDGPVSAGGVSGGTIEPIQIEVTDDEAFNAAEDMVGAMTLEEKISQMFLVDLSDLDTSPQNQKKIYRITESIRKTLREQAPGGVWLSEKNIKSEKQARKLIQELKDCASGSALYVAVEEEGGGTHSLSSRVDDLKVAGYIMPGDIGGALQEDQIYQTAARIAAELGSWGVNLNLAPIADISSRENQEYARRCFGADAETVSNALEPYVKGMRDYGLATTLKYFPGVGSVPGDFTKEILKNNSSLMALRKNDFAPYSEGIRAGTDCIMVGSFAVPKLTVNDKLPAFLSKDIVTSLLRQELNFEGVVMTPPLSDAVITKNYTPEYVVTEAVKSGCDMLVRPSDYEAGRSALAEAVQSGAIDEKVINTAVRRILQDKIRRGICVLQKE